MMRPLARSLQFSQTRSWSLAAWAGLSLSVISPTHALAAGCLNDSLIKVLATLRDDFATTEREINEDLQNLAEAYRELDMTFGPEDRARYMEAKRLAPLFEKGIVQEAIIDEMSVRGFTTKRNVDAILHSFKSLPMEEQLHIVDGVVDRLILSLDDEISLANVKSQAKAAKKAGMSIEEYGQFLSNWRSFEKDGYQEVKLILAMKLMGKSQKDAAFLRSVSKNSTRLARFKRWLSGRSKARPMPTHPMRKPTSPDAPEYAHEIYDTQKILDFAAQADPKLVESFFRENIDSLSFYQLTTILQQSSPLYKKLSPSTLKAIKSRRTVFSQLQDIHQQLANLDRVTQVPEGMKELEKSITNHQLIKDSIQQLEAPGNDILGLATSSVDHFPSPGAMNLETLIQARVASPFLEEALPFLNRTQLEKFIKSEGIHKLPLELQERIKARFNALRRTHEQILKLEAIDKKLAGSSGSVAELTKRISELKKHPIEMPESDFRKFLAKCASEVLWEQPKLEIRNHFYPLLQESVGRLSSRQYRELVSKILEVGRFKVFHYDSHRVATIQNIKNFAAQVRYLAPSDIAAIRQEIVSFSDFVKAHGKHEQGEKIKLIATPAGWNGILTRPVPEEIAHMEAELKVLTEGTEKTSSQLADTRRQFKQDLEQMTADLQSKQPRHFDFKKTRAALESSDARFIEEQKRIDARKKELMEARKQDLAERTRIPARRRNLGHQGAPCPHCSTRN